jgi:hypothetical protein
MMGSIAIKAIKVIMTVRQGDENPIFDSSSVFLAFTLNPGNLTGNYAVYVTE